jgi:hypothetical protein
MSETTEIANFVHGYNIHHAPAILTNLKPEMISEDLNYTIERALLSIIDDLRLSFIRINTAYLGQCHRPSVAVITELVALARQQIDHLRLFRAISEQTWVNLRNEIKNAHFCSIKRRDHYTSEKARLAEERIRERCFAQNAKTQAEANASPLNVKFPTF